MPSISPSAIVILIVIALLVGGGILAYQYWWVPKQETLEEKTTEESAKLTVVSPNGGETWEYGKTYEIKWEKGDNPDDTVTIFLNNDKIWSNPLVIASNASNTGNYGWTIPNSLNDSSGAAVTINNDSDYKILVQSANGGNSDFSDATFSIVGAAAPNTPDCSMKWWFDSGTTTCGYKQFCGAYMYYGLQTFDTEADCKAHLPSVPACSMKWWFDSNTTVCGYTQFCGAYMYYGLQTFDTESDCLAHLPYTPACSMKWWFDSSNTTCGYKQFCGAYMYYGLQTFDTEADCKAHLPSGI